MRDDNAVLICDLTNPDIVDADGPHRCSARTSSTSAARGFSGTRAASSGWRCSNYGTEPRRSRLRLDFAADFADIFEVRGAERPRRGVLHEAVLEPDAVTLAYTGLDDQRARDPAALRAGAERDRRRPRGLRRRARRRTSGARVFVEIRCGVGYGARSPRRAFFTGLREARRDAAPLGLARGVGRRPRTRSSTRRCAARSPTSTCWSPRRRRGPIPTPASPGSAPSFGRDALITALQTLWLDPAIARGRAAPPRRAPGDRGRRRGRRRAGQDPARGALRRDGRAARGAVRPLLRQRRRDAALRDAGRRLPRAHRRSRHHPRRSGRTSRRRSPGSTPTATATATASSSTAAQSADGPDQPGLEGQPRLGLPRRRRARARARSRWCEVQAYVYGAWRAAAAIARRLKRRDERGPGAAAARGRPAQALRRRRSSTRSSAPTCWRSTATSGPAACAARTPATRC